MAQIISWTIEINVSIVATNDLTADSSEKTVASAFSAAESSLRTVHENVGAFRSAYPGSTPLKYPVSNRNLPLGR
jgi:hypothetical protein